MNRRQKKRAIGIAVGILLVMQIAAKNNSDAIIQLLNETEDAALQQKLLLFDKGGIERPVQISSYSADDIISYAKSLQGIPHRMGGITKKGLDCSGLVMLVLANFRIKLPHGSEEQARYGKIIPPGDPLEKGDLVFFHSTYRTSRLVTHSGIYIGDGKFIHSSSSRGVMISELNDPLYWSKHYLFATRLSN